MRLLLLQPQAVRKYPSPLRMHINAALWTGVERLFPRQAALTRIPQQLRAPHWIDLVASRLQREIVITSEFNHYGDLPAILGTGNVTAADRYHPAYFEDRPEGHPGVQWERYPSNFGFPRPRFTSLAEIERDIRTFDVVLASIRLGSDARSLLRKARAAGGFVALFDNIDHEAVYIDSQADLFRGFSPNEFDIFFKKDIPLDNSDSRLIPICPVPTKASEPESTIPWEERENDLFFVGAYRPGTTRRDRKDLCDALGAAFPRAKLLVNAPPISLTDHDGYARRTRILLSPSGRVWCSFRHADYGRWSTAVVMPKPNCKTAGPPFVDMENAVLYETRIVNGEHRMADPAALIDKISYLLKNPDVALRIGRSNRSMIETGHTTMVRAAYIADRIREHASLSVSH